ncbi:MAG: DUF3795 domain-containing protein [Candidatus Glassbacteria bacterium]|nr:DUF3795 domain-containing protein [Candidatus Glassbacteria bacterium]
MAGRQEESMIAYCGLYCGDCPIFGSGMAGLAKELLVKLEESHLERWGPGLSELTDEFKAFANYRQGLDFLNALDLLRCERTCRQGGGGGDCRIRACCREKGFEGCWLCAEMESCEKLDWLTPVNRGAHLKNLTVIREQGKEEFLEGEKAW